MPIVLPLSLILCNPSGATTSLAASWPQFRGANASGVAASGEKLPAEIGPERNVIWKTALPAGHSSPVVHGDRIYLTGEEGKSLFTIAIDRRTGKILWRVEAPHDRMEEIHSIGSRAQPSPATDGERVVSFFGSCGLFCYAPDSKLLWSRPLGPFKNNFGAGSSPIIIEDRVILNQDHDTDSFLMALDKKTGEILWRTDRSEFPRGYATPVLWEGDGRRQIVVSGTLRVAGYDFAGGEEVWTVRGTARIVNMTPVVGADGILYVSAWTAGGDDSDRITVAPFLEAAAERDANKNGFFEVSELPEGDLKQRFTLFDRDKSGTISESEYEGMRRIFDEAKNVILAIKPGGKGDITGSHVLWKQTRTIPYIPSPLYHQGYLFMVKNGGIVSCLDAKTGEPAKQGRVAGKAEYYSSPVAGDGKIYLISQRGELSVITAEPEWKEIATARFDEDAYATPAIAGGRIYLRTAGYLYAFGLEDEKRSRD